MPANKRDYIIFGVVLIVCALGLGLEYLLRALGAGSLCGTEACEMTEKYLGLAEFGENELVLLGFVFFVVLSGLLVLTWFFKRRPGSRCALVSLWVLIAGALAFDGTLMGYQLSMPGPPCLLCAIVAGAVLAVLAAACWHGKSKSAFAAGLAIWCGGFLGSSLLDHSGPFVDTANRPVSLEEAVVAQKNCCDKRSADEYYLFFSLGCSHCGEVLENLALSRPEGRWLLVSIDRDPESLEKLAGAVERKNGQENIFTRILEAKSGGFERQENIPGGSVIPSEIEKATQKAVAYFKNLDLPGVPVLIVKKQSGVRVILPGTRNIACFLMKEGKLEKWKSG